MRRFYREGPSNFSSNQCAKVTKSSSSSLWSVFIPLPQIRLHVEIPNSHQKHPKQIKRYSIKTTLFTSLKCFKLCPILAIENFSRALLLKIHLSCVKGKSSSPRRWKSYLRPSQTHRTVPICDFKNGHLTLAWRIMYHSLNSVNMTSLDTIGFLDLYVNQRHWGARRRLFCWSIFVGLTKALEVKGQINVLVGSLR